MGLSSLGDLLSGCASSAVFKLGSDSLRSGYQCLLIAFKVSYPIIGVSYYWPTLYAVGHICREFLFRTPQNCNCVSSHQGIITSKAVNHRLDDAPTGRRQRHRCVQVSVVTSLGCGAATWPATSGALSAMLPSAMSTAPCCRSRSRATKTYGRAIPGLLQFCNAPPLLVRRAPAARFRGRT